MKKILLGILIAVVIGVLTVSAAYALPANKGVNKAKEVSPAITDNGIKAPPEFVAQFPESQLTKVVFIRYAPGKEPACNDNGVCDVGENWKKCPSDCPKNGGDEEPGTACYEFLTGSKPKWSWIEDYYYTIELETASVWATSVWNEATSVTIFGNGYLGAGIWGEYDYTNSIVYGDYLDPNVIGVTAIWFRGKNIYEYDILLDIDYFPGSVDLDTVVLHEFGHGAGLGDLYDSVCASEVMYGYYDGVDLDLGSGDITGIQELYGQ